MEIPRGFTTHALVQAIGNTFDKIFDQDGREIFIQELMKTVAHERNPERKND